MSRQFVANVFTGKLSLSFKKKRGKTRKPPEFVLDYTQEESPVNRNRLKACNRIKRDMILTLKGFKTIVYSLLHVNANCDLYSHQFIQTYIQTLQLCHDFLLNRLIRSADKTS